MTTREVGHKPTEETMAAVRGRLLAAVLRSCDVDVRDCTALRLDPPGSLTVEYTIRDQDGHIIVHRDDVQRLGLGRPVRIVRKLKVQWP